MFFKTESIFPEKQETNQNLRVTLMGIITVYNCVYLFFFNFIFYFLNFKIFNSYMRSQTWTPLPLLYIPFLVLLLLYPIGFHMLCFHFHLSQNILFPLCFPLLFISLSRMCLSFPIFVHFPFFFHYWFLVLFHCGQKRYFVWLKSS